MTKRELITAVIDTNVICRHALQDHAIHSPAANTLFEKLARGEVHVLCPATAIFEALHILHGRNASPRKDVVDYFTVLGHYPGWHVENAATVGAALDFWSENPALDFADCYYLALAAQLQMPTVYTFDKKMDRYPGIERLDP